jgi:hypothetical protein
MKSECRRAADLIFHHAMAKIVAAHLLDMAMSVSFAFFAITQTKAFTLEGRDYVAHSLPNVKE